MVRGRSLPVTREPGTYQWADIETIARGRGRASPSFSQALLYALRSSAFIGLPWPMNSAGIRPRPIASEPINFHLRPKRSLCYTDSDCCLPPEEGHASKPLLVRDHRLRHR